MQDIINSLFNYAFDNGIQVEYTDKLHSRTRPFADIRSRSIVINSKWYCPEQIPFIIAHEISHVLQCDQNDAILSFSTLLTTKYEHHANVAAITLLIPYYSEDRDVEDLNLNEFMNLFKIPNSLADDCQKAFKEYIS